MILNNNYYIKSLLLLLFLIINLSTSATIYYVSPLNGNDNVQCGDTLSNACPSLLKAINLIQIIGSNESSTILLNDGIYNGTDNNNLNVFGLNIIIQPLNSNSTSSSSPLPVIFDGSELDSTISNKFINIIDYNNTSENNNDTVTTSISIYNIIFKNYNQSASNGAIINSSIVNSEFNLEIVNCTFDNNLSKQGSVIYLINDQDNQFNVNITIESSQFTSNTFALFFSGYVNLLIDTSNFYKSYTLSKYQLASILYMSSGTFNLLNSNVTHSTISTPIVLYGLIGHQPSLIDNCYFNSNTVQDKGGVLSIGFTYIDITNSNFENNQAISIGGVLFGHGVATTISILNSKFINNKSGSKGGVISYQDSIYSNITGCEFINNNAISGGSISLEYTDQLFLNNCTFIGNDVENQGGAIYTYFGSVDFSSVIIQDNVAAEGGAIYCASSSLYIPSSLTLDNNTDSANGTESYLYNHGFKISVNSYNIYCALDPTYTYCDVTGDEPFSSLCGYVNTDTKDSGLSKGQIAGIVVGATLGASLLAFIGAYLISKTTIGEHYRSLIRKNNDGRSSRSDSEPEPLN